MLAIRYIHEWIKQDSHTVIYTFPMIHIGEASYYERVSIHLNQLNLLLEEGLDLTMFKEIGKYQKLANFLNLATQVNTLKIPLDLDIVNIDMDSSKFFKKYLKLSLKEKIGLSIYDKFKLSSRFRDKIFKSLYRLVCYTEDNRTQLINPENHYSFKHKKSDFENLIAVERDVIIEQNLKKIVSENQSRPFRFDIGILLGDYHMPVVYKLLKKFGYQWKLYDTIEVLRFRPTTP